MVDAMGSILSERKDGDQRVVKSSTKIKIKAMDSDDDSMGNLTPKRRIT